MKKIKFWHWMFMALLPVSPINNQWWAWNWMSSLGVSTVPAMLRVSHYLHFPLNPTSLAWLVMFALYHFLKTLQVSDKWPNQFLVNFTPSYSDFHLPAWLMNLRAWWIWYCMGHISRATSESLVISSLSWDTSFFCLKPTSHMSR